MKSLNPRQGFTLIEVLLVIGIIGILAAIVIIAVNPVRQLAQAENAQRRSDVNSILNAIYQYAIDNDGSLPSTIASTTCSSASSICRTAASDCTNGVSLAVLTNSETYLVSMPIDPDETVATSSGYKVAKSGNARVTVCAPNAELSATISVTR